MLVPGPYFLVSTEKNGAVLGTLGAYDTLDGCLQDLVRQRLAGVSGLECRREVTVPYQVDLPGLANPRRSAARGVTFT